MTVLLPRALDNNLGRVAVGRKAAEDDIMDVIHDNFCALFAVVLFKLGKRLDDGHNLQAAGSGCGEHHFSRFYLWQSPVPITLVIDSLEVFSAAPANHLALWPLGSMVRSCWN